MRRMTELSEPTPTPAPAEPSVLGGIALTDEDRAEAERLGVAPVFHAGGVGLIPVALHRHIVSLRAIAEAMPRSAVGSPILPAVQRLNGLADAIENWMHQILELDWSVAGNPPETAIPAEWRRPAEATVDTAEEAS